MFKKVKNWLGIEGIKLDLIIPEDVKGKSGVVHGKIRFFSKNEQSITSIKVVMIERYSRGRGKEKLIDDYLIGEVELKKNITVLPDKPLEVKFELPYTVLQSEIDDFESKNIFARGIAQLAKLANQVKSEFRIEAEAEVKGTVLNPFDKEWIRVK